VSNPTTRKDLAARTWGVFWYSSKIPVLFEIMVQIKQKRGTGVERPSPRSKKAYTYRFSGGMYMAFWRLAKKPKRRLRKDFGEPNRRRAKKMTAQEWRNRTLVGHKQWM